MTWDEVLSVVGNVVGILSAVISGITLCRTGSIKKSLQQKAERETTRAAYIRNKDVIDRELEECMAALSDQGGPNSFNAQQVYIQRLSNAVINLKTLNETLSDDEKKVADRVISYIKKANSNRSFAILEIITDIQYLRAIMKKESVISYD